MTPGRGLDGLGRARTWEWPDSTREVGLQRHGLARFLREWDEVLGWAAGGSVHG